jgi:hypothetical protein
MEIDEVQFCYKWLSETLGLSIKLLQYIQCTYRIQHIYIYIYIYRMGHDRLCGLVVRVLGYRSGVPGSIPGTTRKKKVMGLERGPISLVNTTEELLDRTVAAPV